MLFPATRMFERVASEPRTVTLVAGRVSPIATQEYAIMDLVRFALDELEEFVDSVKSIVAVENDIELLRRQLFERDIDRDTGFACNAKQIAQVHAPLRGIPWMDRPLPDCLIGIRDDEIHIDSHGSPKTLALRARTDGIVEREHPGIGILVANSIVAAFIMLSKSENLS